MSDPFARVLSLLVTDFFLCLVAADRRKLSKRDGASTVDAFRVRHVLCAAASTRLHVFVSNIIDLQAAGNLPEALLNFVGLLGWNPGTEQELMSLQEMGAQFDLERAQKVCRQY